VIGLLHHVIPSFGGAGRSVDARSKRTMPHGRSAGQAWPSFAQLRSTAAAACRGARHDAQQHARPVDNSIDLIDDQVFTTFNS
jgi:hypothetical protein